MKKINKSKGFSLIELMIVIAIIGILVAVAIPQFDKMREEAKIAKTLQNIDTLISATVKFNSLEDRELKSLYDLEGKYLVEVPVADEWDKPFNLAYNSGSVSSAGPDRDFGTGDDIVMYYKPDIMLIDAKYIIKDNSDGVVIDKNGNEIKNLNGDIITLKFSKSLYFWDKSGNRVTGKIKNSSNINLESYFSFYDGGIYENPITPDYCTFGTESTIEIGENYITVTLYGDPNTPGEINSNIEPNQFKINIKAMGVGAMNITDTKAKNKTLCKPAIRSGSLEKIQT